MHNHLPYKKINGAIFYDAEEVTAFIEKHSVNEITNA
jgi:hypothetical protein